MKYQRLEVLGFLNALNEFTSVVKNANFSCFMLALVFKDFCVVKKGIKIGENIRIHQASLKTS